MESMTLWQFYAVFAVLFVSGVLLCWAMLTLGARNPILGHRTAQWAANIRDKLFIAFIILAGIASYQTLPDIFNAFTSDVSTVVAEATVDLGEKAIRGEDLGPGVDLSTSLREATTGVIWGEYNESQHNALMLMTGFWFFLAWCCFVGNYAKSPSSWWQKFLKIVAYPLLTSVILLWPMNVHYLNADELTFPAVMLLVAGVLIAASHDWSPAPPPLPGAHEETLGGIEC